MPTPRSALVRTFDPLVTTFLLASLLWPFAAYRAIANDAPGLLAAIVACAPQSLPPSEEQYMTHLSGGWS